MDGVEVGPVSPFERIVAVTDGTLVQLYEDHARGVCRGAAAWSAYHYRRSKGVVVDSWRDGPRDIILLETGEGELDLVPSFSPAGIRKVDIIDTDSMDKNIRIEYAGLAGGGVGVTLCRAQAKGVLNTEVIEQGGGDKLGRASLTLKAMKKITVGIDDTDKGGQGATWSLANEIGVALDTMDGVEYLNHTLVQLYPKAPTKTTNCVGTVLTFGVLPSIEQQFIQNLTKLLEQGSCSEDTSFSLFHGIIMPDAMHDFAYRVRSELVTLEDLDQFLEQNPYIKLHIVTGRMGGIGAVGALAFAERHEDAVVPEQ